MPGVGTKFCFHPQRGHSKTSSSAFALFFVLDVYTTKVVFCDRQVAVRLRRWLRGQSSHWACSPWVGGSSRGLQRLRMVNVIALLCHPSIPTVRWEMATKDPDAHRWASLGYAVVNKRPWLKQDRRWLLAPNVVLWPSHMYSGMHVSPADRKTDRHAHVHTD